MCQCLYVSVHVRRRLCSLRVRTCMRLWTWTHAWTARRYTRAQQIEKEGKSLNDVTPVLLRITDARFKQMVKPGDEITIEVTMKETISRFFFMSAKVLKGGKPAMTIGFALAMVEGDGK